MALKRKPLGPKSVDQDESEDEIDENEGGYKYISVQMIP